MATDKQRAWADRDWSWRPTHWEPPKLTATQRAEIARRLADGETVRALALEFGVSRRTVEHYR